MAVCALRAPVVSLFAGVTLASLALAIAGCKHDLDQLSKDHDKLLPEAGSSGKAGGSSGKGGSAGAGRGGSSGSGGTAGSNMPDGGSGLPCDPCEELSPAAKALGLRSCCYGVPAKECGLTVGDGKVCLPRTVPGQPNETCGEIRILGTPRMGCCRPDARCGVLAENLGLGCVAREELAPLVADGGPAPMPIACEYTCKVDGDCSGVPKDVICAEPAEGTQRTCVATCQSDGDCPGKDEVCSLTPDVGMNRWQNICTAPQGDAVPGEACARIEDCSHFVCVRPSAPDAGLPAAPAYCSQLCRSPSDCPSGFGFCTDTETRGAIQGTPGLKQNFDICRK